MKVKLLEIYGSNTYDEYDYISSTSYIVDKQTPWEDVSDEDYGYLKKYIDYWNGQYGTTKYILVQEKKIEKMQPELSSYIEKFKKAIQEKEERDKKRLEKEEKRKQTMAKKKAEKEKKLLEKLQEKYGV